MAKLNIDLKVLVNLYESGKTISDLANQFSCSRRTIKDRLKLTDVTFRPHNSSRYLSDLERFQKFIIKDEKGCLIWQGGYLGEYTNFSFKGRSVLAHRWIYAYYNGLIPKGYEINHKCRNKRCVNIEHLECLTKQAHRIADFDVIEPGRLRGVTNSSLKRKGKKLVMTIGMDGSQRRSYQ